MDSDDEPFDESWSYPSIVGMLLYLSTNTCFCYGSLNGGERERKMWIDGGGAEVLK
jgi:hypothetical protein